MPNKVDRITMRLVEKYGDLRLKHITMTCDVLTVLGLDHLVNDVYEAIAENDKEVNFDINKI
jgi:hypothetical protein